MKFIEIHTIDEEKNECYLGIPYYCCTPNNFKFLPKRGIKLTLNNKIITYDKITLINLVQHDWINEEYDQEGDWKSATIKTITKTLWKK
jgi:hypothetical protein